MAKKQWSLVVTEMGVGTQLAEASVDADHWMAALKAGRRELGEVDAVPPGSSCAVAPDGKVTIHDPVERRTYVLTPQVASRSLRVRRPKGPTVPAESAPRESSAPAEEDEEAPLGEGPRPSMIPSATLITERNQEPTSRNPLLYRERVFFMENGTCQEDAARFLFGVYSELREDLEDRPAGKFFNLAVFDHRWTVRPQRLPIATLQWKDWRGEPQLGFADPNAEAPLNLGSIGGIDSVPAPQSMPAPEPVYVAAIPSEPPPQHDFQVSIPPPPRLGSLPMGDLTPAPESKPWSLSDHANTDEHNARLADAFEACQDLLFLRTPAEGLDFAIRLFEQLIPTETAIAALYDIDSDCFRCVAVRGDGTEAIRGRTIPGSGGLWAEASKTRDILLVEDAEHHALYDPEWDRASPDNAEKTTMLYVPLYAEDRLMGVIQLSNPRATEFTIWDEDLAVYVGRQLAKFLESARRSIAHANRNRRRIQPDV